jgi:hypothetical protein
MDGIQSGLEKLEALLHLSHHELAMKLDVLFGLGEEHRKELEAVLCLVDDDEFAGKKMREANAWMEEVMLIHMGHLSAEIKAHIAGLKAPGLDVKSKFKLSLPLIPMFLTYEAEFLSGPLRDKAWSFWKELVKGRILL